ncbi:MAG: insulinase family protein [Cytophagaceae bacterium]|nr:insulinase family protein [Cytophagaceae bacterium]
MIQYEKFTLSNGLQVLVHEDHTSPLAVLNVLYNVGSKDEDEARTGFAHLFEHLMFGGSVNIASFDEPLQKVGGENNAFTSPDLTNYYITLPSANLETAFWLESDRMLSLSFDPKVLEVQRQVVIEEFKQRYLNQPYGDTWLHMREMAYTTHPYRWPTIGKEIAHIEQATMDDVKNFFKRFYIPNNAILVVGGDVAVPQVKALAEKWFGTIPAGVPYRRALPAEPVQQTPRRKVVQAEVPLHAIVKAWHMPGKLSDDYYACDLLGDILGRGKSSRLYQALVQEQKLFSSASFFNMGSHDPGLMVFEGKLNKGVRLEEGEAAMMQALEKALQSLNQAELEKSKIQAESTLLFGEVELLERCMNLAFATNLGNTELINQEVAAIQAVQLEDLRRVASLYLKEECSNCLWYQSKQAEAAQASI